MTKVYNAAVAELDAAITPRDRELISKRIDDIMEQDRAAIKASELDQIYVAHHHREVKCITSACLIRRCVIQRTNLEMYKLIQQVRAIDGVLRWIKTDYVAWWSPHGRTVDLTALKWENTDVQMFKAEPLVSLKFESQPRYVRDAAPPFQATAMKINADYDGSDARAFVLKNIYEPHKCALIMGPPGTGKTYATNTLIDLLEENGDVFIACSTSHVSKNIMGNETSRLRDVNYEEAANTIHSEYMRYNNDPQLYIGKLLKRGVEWFIVDEVGMMPCEFYDFLCHLRRAIPALCIVLVGDYTQLTPVKDQRFINFEKTNILKTAALADIIDGNVVKFNRYMRGDRDDPQGGKAVFDVFMRFNRFIKRVVLIPRDAVMKHVNAAKSARDIDGALRLINAPIETLQAQLRGKRMKELRDTISRLIDDHGTRETFICDGVIATTHDEISHDVPAMFQITAETNMNISYTHATRKVVNKYYMDKHAALHSEVLFIAAPTDTEEQVKKCQDVTLFAGAPLIAVKTLKTARIFNAEMFVVESFYRPPTGWHNLTLMQMKEVAHKMGACSSGTKKDIAESIEYAKVAVCVRNLRSGMVINIPMSKFHDLFRVAYCITVHQSQGQTIREKYTIYDWNLKFLRDEERARAKYVALSRGTRKDHVQIDTSDADVYDDKVLAAFIKHVVLNDAYKGEKPDFNEFAVWYMLDTHFVRTSDARTKYGETSVRVGTCSPAVYVEAVKSFIECCAEVGSNPIAHTGCSVVDGRIVMPQLNPVIFQSRYETMLAKFKARQDVVDRVVKNVTQTIIDNVVKARRKPLDVPILPLAIARRELQINGIDSVLQLRAYLDKRVTHAVESRTVTSMSEIRESAAVEFGGVRQFARRFEKANWLKHVTKRIRKTIRPTYAYQAHDYAAEFINMGLDAYVSAAMDLTASHVNHPRSPARH